MLNQPDIAKLLTRITLAILLLFHGIHKLIHGLGGVKVLVANSFLPDFFAYGVYLGELIAPIFILLGLYARVASAVVLVNMLLAIYLAYGFLLSLSKYGGLSWELPLVYALLALLVILQGSGKYSVNNK